MSSASNESGVGRIDRTRLLPRSGIGVQGPFLLIAPTGNPAIALDARLLDRIELVGRSPKGALAVAGLAAAGVVTGAIVAIPGGFFTCAGMAYLAYERFTEARRRVRSRDLLLVLGDLEVALHVVDGPEAAKRVVDQLSSYTRQAPITRPEVYEDARRRLLAQLQGQHSPSLRREIEGGLHVGGDVVRVVEDDSEEEVVQYVQVGSSVRFRVDEVREYALRGANLPLPGGRLLQAAMALLVVAAADRTRRGEDLEALSRRVGEYEKWTGRTAGR